MHGRQTLGLLFSRQGRRVAVMVPLLHVTMLLVGGGAVHASPRFLVSPVLQRQVQKTEQDEQKPKEPKKASPGIQVFSPEAEISDLLDVCSGMLGIPIEFNRSEVSGPVNLKLQEPATSETVWDLASRALVARGLTTVQMPSSGSLSVVKLADAQGLARLENRSLREARAGYVKVLIGLGHERTESVAEAVKLVLSKSGQVSSFKDTKSLLVADLRPNVEEALAVVAHMDGPYSEMDVLEVRLDHADPVALVALIERIMTTRKAVFGEKPQGTVLARSEARSVLVLAPPLVQDVWRDLVLRFDKIEPTQTLNYFPRRFGVRETASLIGQVVPAGSDAQGWRIVTDDLTGTLVVTATPAQHQQIQDLFTRLESADQGPARPIRSFPIKHRGVEELKELLEAMLDRGALKNLPEVQKAKSGEVIDRKPVEGPTAQIPSLSPPSLATKELGDEVILTADKPTNRLIAMGNARVLEQLALLIDELDVRPSQVMVEATVVSLTDSQTRALGIEMQKLGVSGDVLYRVSSLFGLGSPNPGSSTLPNPGGTGFSGVVLDPGSFSAVVRALETVNKGRTQTIPKVLVNNNQTASLNSVLQTPFVSTNASTTVATTSFGGTQDAGTQISVTPQIAQGDQLVLDYTISISSFVGEAIAPEVPPPRQENRLKSIVTIPDGYTVVVGGLETESKSRKESEVPLLGRLPLLGWLFEDSSRTENRTRFYVFLRCSVMRANGFEDLRYASGSDLASAKVADGWPRLEPRLIR